MSNQPNALTLVDMSSDFTGVTVCSTTGTAQNIGLAENSGGFWVHGHPTNTKPVWVFFTGQTKASGFPVAVGQTMFLSVGNLAQVQFDAEVTDEKICWMKA